MFWTYFLNVTFFKRFPRFLWSYPKWMHQYLCKIGNIHHFGGLWRTAAMWCEMQPVAGTPRRYSQVEKSPPTTSTVPVQTGAISACVLASGVPQITQPHPKKHSSVGLTKRVFIEFYAFETYLAPIKMYLIWIGNTSAFDWKTLFVQLDRHSLWLADSSLRFARKSNETRLAHFLTSTCAGIAYFP